MRPPRAAVTEAGEFNVDPIPPPTTTAKPPSPPPPPPKCDSHATCPWWPYSNSKDFGANAAVILIILFSALFLSIALNTAIRCLLRRRRRRRREDPESGPQPPKPAPSAAALPPPPPPSVVFSAETKLGLGNQAECIICLSEFVEGDELRVLIGCGHAFHTQCVHQWLSSHSSCPTCRASYPLPSSSSSSSA